MKTDNEMKQFIKNNLKIVHPAVQKILTDENYLKEKYELMKAIVEGKNEIKEIDEEIEKDYIKFFLKFMPENLQKKANGYETLKGNELYDVYEEIQMYQKEINDDIMDKTDKEAFEMGLTIIQIENGAFDYEPDYLKNIKARLSKILSSFDTIIEHCIESEKRLEIVEIKENKIKSIIERTKKAVQKFNKATGENIEINKFGLIIISSND